MRARLFALPAVAGLALIALPALPALAGPAPQGPDCVPDLCVVVYDTPGAADSFVVPAGVTVLDVGVGGASGGSTTPADTDGGTGGALEALVPVTPGETLSVLTGAAGATATADPPAGGTGGGGSFLFRGSETLVAAGGGGGAGLGAGGAGGAGGPLRKAALGGANAESATLGGSGGQPGAGGTAPAAGPLTGADGTGPASGPATPGAGGAGTLLVPSGGGGSGWYGGASGSCEIAPGVAAAALTDCGGGGGGASHVADGVTISDVGTRLGDGIVVISYTALTSTTTLTAVPSTIAPLGESDLTATVTGASPTAPAAVAVARKMGTSTARAAAAAAAALTPTGTVTFFSGTTAVFTAPVDPATGVARAVFTAGSTPGPRTITAQYNGDVNFLQSTSAPAIITVTAPTSPTPPTTPGTTPQGSGPALADTGTDHVAGLLATSVALLLGGTGVLVVSRRRVAPRHRAAG